MPRFVRNVWLKARSSTAKHPVTTGPANNDGMLEAELWQRVEGEPKQVVELFGRPRKRPDWWDQFLTDDFDPDAKGILTTVTIPYNREGVEVGYEDDGVALIVNIWSKR
jgi:hypothetical protein